MAAIQCNKKWQFTLGKMWGKGGRVLAQKEALASHPLLIVKHFAAFVFILFFVVLSPLWILLLIIQVVPLIECVTLINEANFALISHIRCCNVSVWSFLSCFWQLKREGYPIVSVCLNCGIYSPSFASFHARCHHIPAGTPLETGKCQIIAPWASSKPMTFTQVHKWQL